MLFNLIYNFFLLKITQFLNDWVLNKLQKALYVKTFQIILRNNDNQNKKKL